MFTNSIEFPGIEFITHDDEPFNAFRAYKFDNAEAFENFIKKYNLLNDCVVIDNYFIVIPYMGTMQKIPPVPVLGHNVPQDAKQLFEPLKAYYEENRIKGNETRFKKFRR